MTSLLEKGRTRSLPLFKQEVEQVDDATIALLCIEGDRLVHEIGNAVDGNPWHFKKGVRLMEIGLQLKKQEYIDVGWAFLRRLGKK